MMLGVSVADFVAVSTVILACAAFWKGIRAGDATKAPNDLQAITAAVQRLGDILEAQKRDRLVSVLEGLQKHLSATELRRPTRDDE